MLTRLEEKLLDGITQHLARHGRAPTLAEIGAAAGIKSKGTVHRYVSSLVRKGHLTRSARGWRGLQLGAEHAQSLTVLPLSGVIGKGRAVAPVAGHSVVNFSELLLGPDRFVLRINGDAMSDAGFTDGDLLIVRRSGSAKSGDLALTRIDRDEPSLHRLRLHGDRIELVAADAGAVSRIYPAKRVKIQGVVAGVVRLYRS